IVSYKPLKDGVIADFDVTAKMLHSFFNKVNAGGIISISYAASARRRAFSLRAI
ncbi:MAG: rod shape-determining protein, partial [Alistipes sp.]|nr:rod shape-determining protein [Alistipes sp.]